LFKKDKFKFHFLQYHFVSMSVFEIMNIFQTEFWYAAACCIHQPSSKTKDMSAARGNLHNQLPHRGEDCRKTRLWRLL